MNVSPSPIIIIERKRSASSRVAAFLLLLAANYVIFRAVCSAYMFTSDVPSDSNPVNVEVRYQRDLLDDTTEPTPLVESTQTLPLELVADDSVIEPQVQETTQAQETTQVESTEIQTSTATQPRVPLAMIRQHPIKFALILTLILTVITFISIVVCMSQGLIPVPTFVVDSLQFMGQLCEEVYQGVVYFFNSLVNGDIYDLMCSFGNFVLDVFEQVKALLYQAFEYVYSFFAGKPENMEQFPTIVNDVSNGATTIDPEQPLIATTELEDGSFEYTTSSGFTFAGSPLLDVSRKIDISDPSKFIPA